MKRVCELPQMDNVRTCYFINENGELYSYSGHNGKDIDSHRILKPNLKSSGYLEYALVCNDCKTIKWVRAHKLVALAYIDGYKKGLQIHHKNGNKQDNRAVNLEYLDARTHSRISSSKELYQYDVEGNLVKKYDVAIEVLKDGFGHHAFNVARGIEKLHKGFLFSYVPLSKQEVSQRLSKSYPRR